MAPPTSSTKATSSPKEPLPMDMMDMDTYVKVKGKVAEARLLKLRRLLIAKKALYNLHFCTCKLQAPIFAAKSCIPTQYTTSQPNVTPLQLFVWRCLRKAKDTFWAILQLDAAPVTCPRPRKMAEPVGDSPCKSRKRSTTVEMALPRNEDQEEKSKLSKWYLDLDACYGYAIGMYIDGVLPAHRTSQITVLPASFRYVSRALHESPCISCTSLCFLLRIVI